MSRWWVLFGVLFLLTGCWDQWELKNRGFALGAALDLRPDGVQVTLQLPVERVLGGTAESGGGLKSQVVEVFSAFGSDMNQALSAIRYRSARRIMLGHIRIYAIGEEQARRGLGSLVAELIRNPEVRPDAWLVVVRGSAANLMWARPIQTPVPITYASNLLDKARRLGELPNVTLATLYISLHTPGTDPVTPILEVTRTSVSVAGLGVFRGDRMVGRLTRAETGRYLLMSGTHRGGTLAVPCPVGGRGEVKLEVKRSRSRSSAVSGSQGARIDLTTEANVSVRSHTCGLPLADPEQGLPEHIGRTVAADLQRLVRKVQREFQADIFGFGALVRGKVPAAFDAAGWHRQFQRLPVNVTVSVNVRRQGLFLETERGQE